MSEATEMAGETGTTVAANEVGDRIAAILDAAESSAERIRATARDEAADIIRHAHAEAANRVAELTREPPRLRDEAARAADETRAAAEEHAQKLVADAKREAHELRTSAEDDVRRIETEGRRRADELNEEIRRLSEIRDGAAGDVRAVVDGLRATADRLHEQVLPHVDAAVADRDAPGWRRLLRRDSNGPIALGSEASADGSPADDLYQRAQALGIRGRSKMTRRELEEAVQRAAGGEAV